MFLIGKWRCESKVNGQDGEYQTYSAVWIGRHILDGYVIADEFRQMDSDGQLTQLGQTYRSYNSEKKTWVMKWHDVLASTWLDLVPEDLGGVRVRLLALGPMHTRGDTMVFVEEDGVLLAGDVVMNHRFLVPVEPASSISARRCALDEVALQRPRQIVPSHGALGDGSLIDLQRAYLELLETRVRAHKAAGRTADETVELTVSEIRAAYPDWSGERWIEPAARVAFREAP